MLTGDRQFDAEYIFHTCDQSKYPFEIDLNLLQTNRREQKQIAQ